MQKWLSWGRQSEPAALAPKEKLKGFYEVAKEALERAYSEDSQGNSERAIKLYRTGLTAIEEGLKLPVPTSGLGPKADTVEAWRYDMSQWQLHATARLRAVESGNASTSAAAPVKPGKHLSLNIKPTPVATSHSVVKPLPSKGSGGAADRARPAPTRKQSGQESSNQGSQQPSKEDQRFRDIVLQEVLSTSSPVTWKDIAGLDTAKQALIEAVVLPTLRADIFQGLRAPTRGVLLYGPPGNGKTMLGKALAHEAQATFFNISASSLTSKWVGESEKLVRALFQVAAEKQPSIIFIDEIDSILSSRSANEHDAMRRLKTEFLVQFDGIAGGADRVIVIGATNRPQEIDDAARRRLVKRIYIPLPDQSGRLSILTHLLKGQSHKLSNADLNKVAKATDLYSASDLTALCKEAAMGPIRELGDRITSVSINQIRAVTISDFADALKVIKPSVNLDMLDAYEKFTKEFGTQ